jgi:hypothetical protein
MGAMDIAKLNARGLREMEAGLSSTALALKRRLAAAESRAIEFEAELRDIRAALAGVEAARELLAGEVARRAAMEG